MSMTENWLTELVHEFNEHQTANSFYGVILYTKKDPYIVKMLRDKDFWDSLDEISGERWTVFATFAEQGWQTFPYTSDDSNVLYNMQLVWKEPSANLELLSLFELENSEDFPLLVAFALSEDGKVLQSRTKIRGDSIDEIYRSTQDNIKLITEAIDGVADENLKDIYGVSSAVSMAVKHNSNWRIIINGLEIWKKLKSIAP